MGITSNLSKRSNVLQAEMDFKLNEHDANVISISAMLFNMAESINDRGEMDKGDCQKCSAAMFEIVGLLVKELMRNNKGLGEAVLKPSFNIACEELQKEIDAALQMLMTHIRKGPPKKRSR